MYCSWRNGRMQTNYLLILKCEIDGIQLENVNLSNPKTNKFLGLTLDEFLKFIKHVKILNGKFASSFYVLWVISDSFGTKIAKNAYFSLIQSHLFYGFASRAHVRTFFLKPCLCCKKELWEMYLELEEGPLAGPDLCNKGY